MTAETVSGRTQERYRGEPVAHDVRFWGSARPPGAGYRQPGLTAECPCGWKRALDGGHTAADLTRLTRQHAGTGDEDP